MARLTPAKARALYQEGARPSEILDYNPIEHEEEMQDMMTGLVGLVYSTDLKAATSFEIGHRIPALVIDVDIMRIFIAPEFKKITPRRIIFEAFTYAGRWERFDTKEMWLGDREAFIEELRNAYFFFLENRSPSASPPVKA